MSQSEYIHIIHSFTSFGPKLATQLVRLLSQLARFNGYALQMIFDHWAHLAYCQPGGNAETTKINS